MNKKAVTKKKAVELMNEIPGPEYPPSFPPPNKPSPHYFHAKSLDGLRTAYRIKNILGWQEAIEGGKRICLVTIRHGNEPVYDDEGREKEAITDLIAVTNSYDEISTIVNQWYDRRE